MSRLVMKFGGTSVANIERIRNVARHVKREVDAGHEVAVVVSAMSGKTNELVAWCTEASPMHDAREYDAVVASGEQVTSGLLAIVLQGMGIQARSWQGWQIPIKTSDAHASARIEDIDGSEIISRFKDRKEVAVIAGFQGIDPKTNRITTLGRGGSDTSAVAIAAAVKADRCDIYTDVDGVYTTDPRIVPKAKRLDKIAFEDMLELASQGAKVLQVRSVELGMVHNMPIFVRSSFDKPEDIDPHANQPPGTLICSEEEIMESHVVTGIAFSKDEAQISVRQIEDKPGVAASIFGPLADANINVDMIVQNVLRGRQDDRPHLHGAGGRLYPRQGHDYRRQGQDRLRAARYRHRRRQDLGDRQRHAQPCRRRRPGVLGPRRTEYQHPGHYNLRDQILGFDRYRLYRARGAHPAHALRSRSGLKRDHRRASGCCLSMVFPENRFALSGPCLD
ncbi:aspartokinase [Bradyrhizobium ottawaense]